MRSDLQKKALIVLVVAAVIAGIFYWYRYHLEWETTEINLGYSPAAQRDQFLAARLFLTSQSIPAQSSVQLSKLDHLAGDRGALPADAAIGPEDTIVLINGRGIINGRRYEKLWRWVEQGGRLILSLENPYVGSLEYQDDLFHELGVDVEQDELDPEIPSIAESLNRLDNFGEDLRRAKKLPADAAPEPEHTLEHNPEHDPEHSGDEQEALTAENDIASAIEFEFVDTDACADEPNSTTILPTMGETVALNFSYGHSFFVESYSPRWVASRRIGGSEQNIAASFAIGDGEITLMSQLDIWRNGQIQCHDHAYMLWHSVNPAGKVWFLENRDAPSLMALVMRYLPYGGLALLLTLILAVWSWMTRFGPVFASHNIERRSFAEHILASATLLWRHGRYLLLISALRRAVEKKMAQKIVGFEQKTREEKTALIAKQTRVGPEYVQPAMFSDAIETLNQFVEFVRTLKEIKDSI